MISNKVIYIDIDNTICTQILCGDYSKAEPYPDRIEYFNSLYEKNKIIYWTARGTMTGIDWTKVTKKQFNDWGVKYHDILFKKPHYDIFIDDKAINPNNCDIVETVQDYFKKL